MRERERRKERGGGGGGKKAEPRFIASTIEISSNILPDATTLPSTRVLPVITFTTGDKRDTGIYGTRF